MKSALVEQEESARLGRLRQAIDKAESLLPVSGPITAFVFLNALQSLEDLPFDEGVQLGGRLFGCQPYLIEERYRDKLERGRICKEDLVAVLRDDLGARGEDLISGLATRHELRLAMLQYPLQTGPVEELRWFVAETDALRRMRVETTPALRAQCLEETRHWIMRDLRGGTGGAASAHAWHDAHVVTDLLQKFGTTSIERWSEATWEAVMLQILWRLCRVRVEQVSMAAPPTVRPVRHRDLLLEVTGEDCDLLVHALLIRFCAAYADQGLAHWPLPHRDEGFFKSFLALYRQPGGPPDAWLQGLSAELSRIEAAGLNAQASILESLSLLGVGEEEWNEFLPSTLLALRGWASMIRQMEVRGDRVPTPAPPGTTDEFLAVRLILERVALTYVARTAAQYRGPLAELRDAPLPSMLPPAATHQEHRAFLVFQLAQVLGWSPSRLFGLSQAEWSTLVAEMEAFSGLERRRLFQLAYERQFRTKALDALSIYTQRPVKPVPTPRFQAVFCIDAREESFRRHLEELAPDTETFSAAGFFGVAMYYRGVADAHYTALCPIVIRPRHWVIEEVVYSLEEENRRRAKTRRALGTASHRVHVGSRSFAGGALLTASLGVLASIPLVARVLFPHLTARIRQTVGRFVAPPVVTRLRLERIAEQPGPDDDNIGFSLDEMAQIGERMLREIGFRQYSRLVILMGHGSFCLNNPHKSAYDCGACSGSAGGPNARALAMILNDPRVRQILETRGLAIPATTRFLGALHNTCNDSITYSDLDLLPKSHLNDFEQARATLEQTCERNAHERCRRFYSAPLDISLEGALRHVEERAEDLAQTRPEFGNASNAMCIVARRSRTRGLFLDRRAFLVSYDPAQDDLEQTVLSRILGAVVPVCEGINLMYHFSYTDPAGWGSGTKLPHNVTSLLGVMDGAASDLRLGLPWQGVEIHEPVRCLFVIETTPTAIRQIMERNPVVGRILRNRWVQLALLNPESAEILLYRNDQFEVYQPERTELPKAESSFDWYRGWRDHLGFAIIEK